MFERLRRSLADAISRASSPEETRAALAMMREALVEAKVGVSQLRATLDDTRAQLARERHELETVQRRGRLAVQINDAETVRVAAQFERRHSERVAVLERKLAAQEAELDLAEREVAEMAGQLKAMVAGAGRGAVSTAGLPNDEPDAANVLRREVDRAAREAEAERKLAELKRRMGY
jgi:phage shock protein A